MRSSTPPPPPPRPFWYPRGVRLHGVLVGGPLRAPRPPTLARPIHPSWARSDDSFVPEPVVAREATSRRECQVLHRVALTDAQAAKRLRGAEPTRAAATDVVLAFVSKHRAFSPFADVLADSGEPFSSSSVSAVAALEPKSTETIRKRAGALRMYSGWLAASPYAGGDPFGEAAVFSYLCFLADERAPATRGATFRETINWMGGLFSFDVAATASSARVRGQAVRLLRTRGVLRQRDPLTVSMVEALEKVIHEDADDYETVVAGSALFILYARARVGDVARSMVEPVVDLAPDRSSGYCQGELLGHKTAKPGTKQSLPLVAPAFGVVGRDWASPCLAARARQRLHAPSAGTLLQAPSASGGWTKALFSTVEFGSAFRNLLLSRGFAPTALANIGSHSLKTTPLSWLAKRGVAKDVRRTLGYHAKIDEKSMEAYSRDSLAGPLRILERTIVEIKAGSFKPDVTRSGQLVAQSLPEDDSSVSSCAACSSSSEDPEAAGTGGEAATTVDQFIRNASSGCAHVLTADGRLTCGREVPVRYSILQDLPGQVRLCGGCF